MSQNFWTVVVVVALFVGLLGLMALGWRNRT